MLQQVLLFLFFPILQILPMTWDHFSSLGVPEGYWEPLVGRNEVQGSAICYWHSHKDQGVFPHNDTHEKRYICNKLKGNIVRI